MRITTVLAVAMIAGAFALFGTPEVAGVILTVDAILIMLFGLIWSDRT